MKVKLFSHTDLDGIGSAIVGKVAFENIDIEYCDYNNINEKIKAFIENKDYENFDYVYITDISVNEEVAELINNTHPSTFKEAFNLGEMFQLLDHHPTAIWLNKYYWAHVVLEQYNEKTSGTRLFYNLLMEDGYLQESKSWKWDKCSNLYNFVEMVRKYDTWLWKEKYHEDEPKMWNDLFHIMGREDFINSILYRITSYPCFDFCDFDITLLEYKQREIDNYIEKKNGTIAYKEIQGYKAGVVFADQYVSELGNKLSESHTELDFIVIIDMSRAISYRTVKDYVNLGEVAKVYGGGGHSKSSGSEILERIREEIISLLFTEQGSENR